MWELLPWERHSLTAFGRPGVGGLESYAPKRRALLLHQAGSEFTYQPHRSGGLQSRPNLSMSSQPTEALGEAGEAADELTVAIGTSNRD
eukprot:SAG22_NODE_18863_length_280_cov_1.143646_1_plen_88_part_01